MELELSQRIKFCRICKNATHDIQHGVLCGLTNEKPTFKEKCDHFTPVSEDVEIPDFTTKKTDPAQEYIKSISSLWRSREYKISDNHNETFTQSQLNKLPSRYNFLYSNSNAIMKISLGLFGILSAVYFAYLAGSISYYLLPYFLFGLYFLHIGSKRYNKVDEVTYFTNEKVFTKKKSPINWKNIEYILKIKVSTGSSSEIAGVKLYGQKEPIELFLTDSYNLKTIDIFKLMEMYRYQAKKE